MKNYVTIQSSKTIMVNAGLDYENLTNYESDIPDRLKVNPIWIKQKCLIREGKHDYPAFITKWKVVQNLSKEGVLTIGSYSETTNEEEAKEAKEKLEAEMANVKKKESVKEVKEKKEEVKAE